MFTSIYPRVENVIFPGGEVHLNGINVPQDSHALALLRGGDSDALLQAAMWADMNFDAESRTLVMPYLVGARQDKGRPRGADVYARIINDMEARVIVTDPHSDYMVSKLDNAYVFDSTPYTARYARNVGADFIIAPDAGAVERATKVATALGGIPVCIGEKIRGNDGVITHYAIEGVPDDGIAVVVDDICDGGMTFRLLAQSLPVGVMAHLWITHGIFSQGPGALLDAYASVACTDSHPGYSAISHDGIAVYHIVGDMIANAWNI